MTRTARPFRANACPVCRKPFRNDEEVGPVPACECGTRGKEDEEPLPEPPDGIEGDFRFPVRIGRLHFPFPMKPPMDTDELR